MSSLALPVFLGLIQGIHDVELVRVLFLQVVEFFAEEDVFFG